MRERHGDYEIWVTRHDGKFRWALIIDLCDGGYYMSDPSEYNDTDYETLEEALAAARTRLRSRYLEAIDSIRRAEGCYD